MIVRCGRCGVQFESGGEGRFRCPSCRTLNEVRGQADAPAVRGPAPPDKPSPRVSCPECDFRFIVGDVEEAPCPNCGVTVTVRGEEP
jgi:DNA-directed RNA polymerase subunit RPC12/RpoP